MFRDSALRLVRAQRRATRNGFPLASRPDLIRVLRESGIVTLATKTPEAVPPEIKQQLAHADHSTLLIAYLDALIDAKNGDPHAHEIADALHAMLHGENIGWRKHAPATTLALPHLPAIKKAHQTIKAHPQVLKQAQQREGQQRAAAAEQAAAQKTAEKEQQRQQREAEKAANRPGTANNPLQLPKKDRPLPKPVLAKEVPLGNQRVVASMRSNLKHPEFNPFHPHHEEALHDLHGAIREHKKVGTAESEASLKAAKEHFVETTSHPDASVLDRPDIGLRVGAVSSGLRNARHMGMPGTASHDYATEAAAQHAQEAGPYRSYGRIQPQQSQSEPAEEEPPTVQSTATKPVPPPPPPGGFKQAQPQQSGQPGQPGQPGQQTALPAATPIPQQQPAQPQQPIKLEPGKPNPFTGRTIRHPNAHWDPATNSVIYPTGGTQQQPSQSGRQSLAPEPTAEPPENPHAAAFAAKIVAHHQNPNSPPPTTDDYRQFAEHAAAMPTHQQVSVRNEVLGSVDNPQMKEQMANALRHGLAAKFEHGDLRPNPDLDAEFAKTIDGQQHHAADAEPGHPSGPAIPGTPPVGQIQPGRAYNVPTSSLHVDPDRFQYKLHMGTGGVGDTLKGVKYNPTFGGILLVWRDPADGKDYVINGHHRYELAARSQHPDLNVQYIDAQTPVEARSVGALANIAEGHGTALDAAKFLRDSGLTPEEMKAKHQISLKGKVAADAAILSKLSDPLFHKVTVGQLDEDRAKAIAEHLAADPSGQAALLGYIEQQETDRGRDIPPKVVEQLAREWAAAPKTENDQPDLFGDAEDRSTFLDRAVLKTRLRADLTKRLNDFLAVSSKRRETAVRGAGNKIEVDKNQQAADEARNLLDTFDRLSPYKGELQDILNEEGLKYANARNQKFRDIAATNAGTRIRYFLRQAGSKIQADRGAEGANRPAGVQAGGGPEGVSPEADRGPTVDGGGGGTAGAGGVVAPTAKEVASAPQEGAKDPNAKEGQPPPKDKPVTLVFGGSFSPIHEGHLDAAEAAREWMKKQGYNVGKLVLAPSADKLLRAKLGDELVPLEHRVAMAGAAAKSREGIDVSGGPGEEAANFQGKLKRTQLADWAAKNYPGTTVVNVTGADAVPGKAPETFPSSFAGESGTSHEGYYYLAMPREESSLSSGKIRKAMKESGELPKGWMHPEAEAYYKKYLAEKNAPDKSPLHPEREEPKSAGIPEMPGLSPEHRAIEKKATEKVLTEFPAMRQRYLQENAKIGPNGDIESVVLNTDEWRHQFEGYTGTNAPAVHEPASYANKKLLGEMLRSQKGKGNNRFAIYAGGGGSGKGTAIRGFFEEDQYPIRMDQVSDSFAKVSALMDKAKEHGFEPEYIFVDRPPEETWGGVVGRAIGLHKKGGLARTVPLDIALKGNLDARKTALEMLKKRHDVPANIIDNTNGGGERRLLTDRQEAINYLEKRIAEEEAKASGGLREKLHGEVVNRHLAGEIPEHIAHGLVGREAIEEAKRGRAGISGRQPIPADNAARTNAQAAENDRRGESGRPAGNAGTRGNAKPAQAANLERVGAKATLATAHAPAGGADAEGKHFEGGQFIPGESDATIQGQQSRNDKRQHQEGNRGGETPKASGSDRTGGGTPDGGQEGPLPPAPPENDLIEHPEHPKVDEMPAVRALKGLWEHARDAGSAAIIEEAKDTLSQFSTAALYDAAEEFGHPEYRSIGRGNLLKRIFGWLDWMATTTHKPEPGQPPFYDTHYNPPYPKGRPAHPIGTQQNPLPLPSAITPHQVAAAYRQAKTMTEAEFADLGKRLESLSREELQDVLGIIGVRPNPSTGRERLVKQIHDMIGERRK